MDFKEAQELVKLPKWVVDEDGEIVEELTIDQEFPMRRRLNLANRDGIKREFVLDVKQSEKFGMDVTEDDMTQGFVDAFNSFVRYLNVQTRITINKMVI